VGVAPQSIDRRSFLAVSALFLGQGPPALAWTCTQDPPAQSGAEVVESILAAARTKGLAAAVLLLPDSSEARRSWEFCLARWLIDLPALALVDLCLVRRVAARAGEATQLDVSRSARGPEAATLVVLEPDGRVAGREVLRDERSLRWVHPAVYRSELTLERRRDAFERAQPSGGQGSPGELRTRAAFATRLQVALDGSEASQRALRQVADELRPGFFAAPFERTRWHGPTRREPTPPSCVSGPCGTGHVPEASGVFLEFLTRG